jgi:hypothetical protein
MVGTSVGDAFLIHGTGESREMENHISFYKRVKRCVSFIPFHDMSDWELLWFRCVPKDPWVKGSVLACDAVGRWWKL